MGLNTSIRLVFMGTAPFAVPSLRRLVDRGYAPVAVVTGPDRPRGRGQKVSVTAVKAAARELGIQTVLQPESVKDPEFARQIESLEPDIIAVVAYRILPAAVYTQARLGAFNLHGSILPKYRGAAPINRAVMAGEEETGVTTFFLADKVDTGTLILQRKILVRPDETAGEVHDRLMQIGADLVVDTVRLIEAGRAHPFPQDERLVTKAPKIFRDDCRIPWAEEAGVVHNHIRGLSPYPGAWTSHETGSLKIFKSRPTNGTGESGTVLEADVRLVVACGKEAIEVLELQQEGRRRMHVEDFMRGYPIVAGSRLD